MQKTTDWTEILQNHTIDMLQVEVKNGFDAVIFLMSYLSKKLLIKKKEKHSVSHNI